MDSPNLDRALRFKSNALRGGVLENVFMRNVTIGRVAQAVLTINLLCEEGAQGDFPPTVRNVNLENVASTASPRVMFLQGFPGAIIDDIRLVGCTFKGVEATEVVSGASSVLLRDVTIEPVRKPRPRNAILPPAPE